MGAGWRWLAVWLALVAWFPVRPAAAAEPAPAVETLLVEDLQRLFAADDGKVRLLLVLSPS
jgi:hypothetical protein